MRFGAYSLFVGDDFWFIYIDSIAQSFCILSLFDFLTFDRYFRFELKTISWKHELLLQLIYFLYIERLLFCFFEFLDPVCILESVECILWAAAVGGYIADHDSSAVASEGIFKYHG